MNSSSETSKTDSAQGTCLCGAVRYEVELPTQFCVHCHCSMCRRNHGAAFVTWFAVPKTRFRLLAGDEALTHYRSSADGTRSFCSRCGSSLFCENDHAPDVVDVTLASMTGPIDRAPEAHVYFDTHVDWLEFPDQLPKKSSL